MFGILVVDVYTFKLNGVYGMLSIAIKFIYTLEQTLGKIAFHTRLAFSLATDFLCIIVMFGTLILNVHNLHFKQGVWAALTKFQ